jgi:hypothetical protein
VNSRVCVKRVEKDSLKDEYYGVLKEIVEIEFLDHPSQKIMLFKCDWFDQSPNYGVRMHNSYKIADINHKISYPKSDPYVLAQQAKKIYYTSFLGCKKPRSDWLVVC